MKPKFLRSLASSLSITLVSSVLMTGMASATDIVWGTNLGAGPWVWNTGANWTGGTAPVVDTDRGDLRKDWTAASTINLNAATITNGVLFDDTGSASDVGVTIGNGGTAANTLTLAGTTPVIQGSGSTLTIGTVLAGTTAWSKTGGGTVILNNAANTITGAVTVNGGVLQIRDGSTNSPAVFNNLTGKSIIVQSGTLDLPRTHVSTGESPVWTLPPISLTGGSLRFRASTGTTNHSLAANISNTGTSTIDSNGGAYQHNINLTGIISGTGTINHVSSSGSGSTTTTRTLTLNNTSTSYSGNWFVDFTGSTTDDFVALRSGAAGALGTGTVTLDDRAQLINNAASGINSLTGVALQKSTSSLTLNGTNAWSNASASLTLAGGTVTLSSTNSSIGTLNLNGTATINSTGGTLAMSSIVATAGTTSGSAVLVPAGAATIANTGSAGSATIASTLQLDNSGITFNIGDTSLAGSDVFLTGPVNSTAGFTKSGIGALSFNNTTTVSGLVTHNAGVIQISSTPAKSFTGGLTGTGQINVGGTGIVTLSGASGSYTGNINVADGASLAGEAVTNGNLTLGSPVGANLWPDFSTVTGAFTANNITLNGVNNIRFVTPPAAGTYTLLKYNGALFGTGSFSANFRGASIDTAGGVGGNEITLTIGTAASLIWNNAATTSLWDIGVSANWNNGGADDEFFEADTVTFNDSPGSDQTIVVSSTVTPGSITFASTNDDFDYAFSGSSISGLGNLVKSGNAVVTLGMANTYSGGTTLNEGRLRAGDNNALGSGVITFNGGILSSNGASPWTLPNNILLTGNPTLGDTTDNGVLTLAGAVTLTDDRTVTALSDTTISGAIGGVFDLTKEGSGTLALTGSNATSGTTVSSGVLSANLTTTQNSLGSGAVSIASTATVQINNTNTATATGPTLPNTITGSGLLKYNFAAGTATTRSASITGLSGFNGTLQLSNSGATADKLNAAAGINAPNASVVIDSGSQLYVVTLPSTFSSVSLSGAGNSENRGAIRLANTLNANLVLKEDSTIGSEGGTVNGTVSSGLAGTQILTVGTSNSIGNSTFSGIIGGGTGTIELIKVSAGTMTLAAANTYTGDTFIDQGTLNLTGSIAGNLLVSNLSAAAVSGEGSVGGTMTFGATGINASLAINPTTAAALTSAGTFGVAEAGTVISVNFSTAPAAAGTYTVLGHGGTTATPANFALGTAGYRPATFDTTTDPAKVTITTVAKDLTWEGNASAAWDVDTASNWESLPGPVSEKFYQLDSVTFNDSATIFAPTLAVTVNPTAVTFDNTANAYTLTGAGSIAGATTLTKSGSGSVTLSTPNTFTGAVTVNAGKLQLGNAGALGDSTGGAKTVTINSGGQLDLNNQSPTARTYSFKIAGNGDGTGALVNSNGGGVASNAGVLNLELLNHATIGGASRFDIGWAGGAGGTITGNGKTLTKTGANQINLRGNASATEIDIVVSQGTLGIEDNDNAFGGTTGSVSVASGATVSSYGARTVATPITLNGGATLGHLGGGTPSWTGAITLAGNATINSAAAANTINLDGVISGTGFGLTVPPNGGTVNLNAANTFSGGLTVGPTSTTATTVNIGAASTLEVDSGKLVQVANTAASGTAIQTLNVDGSVTNAGSLRVARPGVLNLRSGGSWSQSGAAVVEGVGGYTATMNVNSGSSFTHTGSSTFKLNGAPGNSGQALLNLSGTFTTSAGFEQTTVPTSGYGRVTMTGGSLVLGANVPQLTTGLQFVLGTGGGTIDTSTFSTAISANISGTGNSLTKLGTGTLTLSGTNSYTGPTWLDFGALAGNGAAGSAITAEADTIIAPGTGIGTFAAAGATLKSGSTLAIQIDSTADTADKLVSSAAVDITDASVSFAEIGTGIIPGGTELVILDYTGTTLTGTFTGYAEGASITVGSNSFTLSYTDSSRVTLTSTTAGSAYDSWIDGFFTGVTNPLTVGPNADPDGDGVANLIEFLTNGVPNSNGDRGLLWVGTSGNQLVMSLAIRGAGTTFAGSPSPSTTVDGITASIEGSLDLNGFTSAVSGTTFVLPATWSPTAPVGHSYHSFKLDASSGLTDKGFMRLNATQP